MLLVRRRPRKEKGGPPRQEWLGSPLKTGMLQCSLQPMRGLALFSDFGVRAKSARRFALFENHGSDAALKGVQSQFLNVVDGGSLDGFPLLVRHHDDHRFRFCHGFVPRKGSGAVRFDSPGTRLFFFLSVAPRQGLELLVVDARRGLA